MEVIDRMGADSFTPDSGVMISKTKNSDSESPFQWTIDANPQDINVVDFIRPNGKPSYISIGDYRQLADALFHAGTRSGSEYEYVDKANGLHFYVLDVHRLKSGILTYDMGVRALHSTAGSTYGVRLDNGHAKHVTKGAVCSFKLTNDGKGAPDTPSDLEQFAGSDIYRLSAEADGRGWQIELANELAAVPFGESMNVDVAVKGHAGCSSKATVHLTATSESDPSRSATATCRILRG
jgi:hypothetical protein